MDSESHKLMDLVKRQSHFQNVKPKIVCTKVKDSYNFGQTINTNTTSMFEIRQIHSRKRCKLYRNIFLNHVCTGNNTLNLSAVSKF